MYKKIDVFINGKYQFSSNRYKSCKAFLQFLKSKSFIIYQSTYEKIVYLYGQKIICHYAK